MMVQAIIEKAKDVFMETLVKTNYQKAFEAAQERLEYIAERDDRTFSQRETENSSYFDGIWDALKIMHECKMESEND